MPLLYMGIVRYCSSTCPRLWIRVGLFWKGAQQTILPNLMQTLFDDTYETTNNMRWPK